MRRTIFAVVFVAGCALWAWTGYRQGYEAGARDGARAQALADVRLSVERGHAGWIVVDGEAEAQWFPACAQAEQYRRDLEAVTRVTTVPPPVREIRRLGGKNVVLVSR
jgi:hypothetical protein